MRHAPAIVVSLVLFAVGAAAWPFTVDDAYIVARYAEHWVGGEGWAMNPGEPSDGVTGPLWAMPMSAAVALGLDPLAVAKGLGLAATVLAAVMAVGEARRRSGGRMGAWVVALVICTQGNLVVWAVAGLSTGLAALLLGLALLRADGPRATPWMVGAAAGLLAWLRPEALPAALVAVGWTAGRRRPGAALAVALAALGIASVVTWRLVEFGSPVPLSFHAKPSDLREGAEYVLRGLAVATAVVGLLPAAVAVSRRRRNRLLAAALGVHVLSVLAAGGDWMPGFRLLVPILPVWAVLVGDGAALYWRTRPNARGRIQMGLVVAAVCGLGVLDLAAQLPGIRDAGRAREGPGSELAALVRHRAGSVATVDVGYVGWASGARVVDLGGLTDAAVAHRPGGHVAKEIDPGWLAARDPDVILLHSALPPRVDASGRLSALAGFPVERRVARMPWVRAHYRVARVVPYAPGYHYAVLERRREGSP